MFLKLVLTVMLLMGMAVQLATARNSDNAQIELLLGPSTMGDQIRDQIKQSSEVLAYNDAATNINDDHLLGVFEQESLKGTYGQLARGVIHDIIQHLVTEAAKANNQNGRQNQEKLSGVWSKEKSTQVTRDEDYKPIVMAQRRFNNLFQDGSRRGRRDLNDEGVF